MERLYPYTNLCHISKRGTQVTNVVLLRPGLKDSPTYLWFRESVRRNLRRSAYDTLPEWYRRRSVYELLLIFVSWAGFVEMLT